MIKQEKKFTVSKPVNRVYGYLKDLHNYAHFFGDAVEEIRSDGLKASVKVPVLGTVQVVLKKRVVDTLVVLKSSGLGVTLTAFLESEEDQKKTKVTIVGLKEDASPLEIFISNEKKKELMNTSLEYIESALKTDKY